MIAWKNGIDVSEYQGRMNWKKAKNAGIDFAYIRSNCGLTLDSKTIANCEKATAQGIPFGLYLYFKPEQDAVEQAQILINRCKATGAKLVPMIDVEHQGGLTKAQITAAITVVVKMLTVEFGKPPTIYTGAWFWNDKVNAKKFSQCPLWVSQYVHYNPQAFKEHPIPQNPQNWPTYALEHPKPTKVSGWATWAAWQFAAGYNGMGKTYGAQSRDLDLNIMRAGAYNTRFVL